MKRISAIGIAICISLLITDAKAEGRPDLRVLFVGNSLTYYNDVPDLFRQIGDASEQIEEIEVDMLAAAGVSTTQHLESAHLPRFLAEGNYNFVVFQDIAGWPICAPEFPGCSDVVASIEEISELIKSNGAEPVWYSTYQRIPAVQTALSEEARRIASRLNIRLANVGAAWSHFETIAGEGAPFMHDGHPNQIGSFIAAATIFQVITGQIGSAENESQELCFREWQGTGLSESNLASQQESPFLECETIAPQILKSALDAANKGFNSDAGKAGAG